MINVEISKDRKSSIVVGRGSRQPTQTTQTDDATAVEVYYKCECGFMLRCDSEGILDNDSFEQRFGAFEFLMNKGRL